MDEEQERRVRLEALLKDHGLSEGGLFDPNDSKGPEEMVEKLHKAILHLSTSGGLDKMHSMQSTGCAEDVLWGELKHKNFRFEARASKGNGMASRWARRLSWDTKLKTDYEEQVGREAKARFRAEWCQGEFDSYLEKKDTPRGPPS